MAESASDQIRKAIASQVTPKAIQRAASRALNKAMTSTRAEASRRVKEELNLKVGDIKKELTVQKAKASDGLRDMRSTLIVSNKPVELFKFGAKAKKVRSARGPRVGTTVKVKQERKLVAGGFIAQMRSGKIGVFKRSGGTTSTGKEKIKLLYSTRVRDVFLNDGFLEKLGDFAGKRLETTLAQELSFEISKGQK